MQNVAPARTYAEEIQNKPKLYELLELVRKDFCVEIAEQSVLSGISCQSQILQALIIKHTTGNNTNYIYVENHLLK